MPSVIRHTAVWSGTPGLPGYSQFYQEVTGSIPGQAQSGQDDVNAMFYTMLDLIPNMITVTVDPIYQVIDVATGAITSEDSVGSPKTPVEGGYVAGWNAQVGVLVEWLTSTFINGKRLRGRTYLVPLGNVADDDGTVPDGSLTTLRAAVAQVVSGGAGFAVWHRPVNGAGGQISAITSAVVRDKAAVLRSRML